MTDVAALKDRVHARLLDEAGSHSLVDREAVGLRLRALLFEEDPALGLSVAAGVVAELLDAVVGLGVIEPLFFDDSVSEIMLNGPGCAFVERFGVIEPLAVDLDARAIELIAQRIIGPLGLRLDRGSPMVDARLPDGSRLHAVLPPLAPDGPVVTIRRFSRRLIGIDDFALDGEIGTWLCDAVRRGANVLIAGATGAGKTSLLNALAAVIDARARIVTIEETAELQLRQPHVVRLEAHPANAEGAGAVSVRDLVRASLRMRPDRLVVGEVRGGEALDLLQALNTGHAGSMCTIHANSAVDALSRLETLALMGGVPLPVEVVRSQILAAIDVVCFVARTDGGGRVVREVVRLLPAVDGARYAVGPVLERAEP